ncbi:hypothetical protein Kpol_1013p5 [Vanderwaltozyma polyspora DSM 70294]|uniref:Diacylglycerol O-acyltransferase n=1 Tax=Vanderwaltozyma polyspora (strain ATCC 22028 / DSM 70294 / BCRC 21397 / CBS 2163 / NBRC 10782 / NRRL Y-8283 / UCD 57-17) TaxID=436907 RepID=A7TH53_VANPO|nr:uncharacterized protein Kpol_1013p5 [Vanderwaltozyma polyspora DSM 70294]EDO18334.1 hypothetical protein Kpol_1013p5 [Vanderwaltozyma polyspora DSM 70294]
MSNGNDNIDVVTVPKTGKSGIYEDHSLFEICYKKLSNSWNNFKNSMFEETNGHKMFNTPYNSAISANVNASGVSHVVAAPNGIKSTKDKYRDTESFETFTSESCCSIETPIARRRQTIITAWQLTSMVLCLIFFLFSISIPLFWFISIPYMTYFLLDKTPANGGVVKRYSPWLRSFGWWKEYCDYFPIRLHKTADLKPTFDVKHPKVDLYYRLRLWPTNYSIKIKKWLTFSQSYEKIGPKYIFGYHPHGVGALGAFGVFATEGCGWSEKFPGIPTSLMTLVTQFQVPYYRDYLLGFGITSVSKKNALKVLKNNHSICIVVGGAMESLLSEVQKSDLVLKRRKGFIKLAINTGDTCLVPTFAFGETNIYNILQTKEGSFMRKLQLWLKENWGFTIPFFYARSVFNYDFGILPFRAPINVVIGSPIYVKEQNLNPTPEIVEHYQNLYIEELKKLYYENRDKYGYGDVELNIVD